MPITVLCVVYTFPLTSYCREREHQKEVKLEQEDLLSQKKEEKTLKILTSQKKKCSAAAAAPTKPNHHLQHQFFYLSFHRTLKKLSWGQTSKSGEKVFCEKMVQNVHTTKLIYTYWILDTYNFACSEMISADVRAKITDVHF